MHLITKCNIRFLNEILENAVCLLGPVSVEVLSEIKRFLSLLIRACFCPKSSQWLEEKRICAKRSASSGQCNCMTVVY